MSFGPALGWEGQGMVKERLTGDTFTCVCMETHQFIQHLALTQAQTCMSTYKTGQPGVVRTL